MFSFFFSSRRRHTRCALVTGVQTCALPIFRLLDAAETDGALNVSLRARVEADLADIDMDGGRPEQAAKRYDAAAQILRRRHAGRSEERRVGQEGVRPGRSRW